MGTLNVNDLKPGMILGSDLRDFNGRFLMGRGVRLTPKLLKIINAWGVIEADIEGVSESELHQDRMAQLDPAILEEADRITRERFLHMDLENPAVDALFHNCVLRKAWQLTESHNILRVEKFNFPAEEDIAPTPPATVDPNELLRRDIKLPTLPSIFYEINEALSDPESSVTHIAALVDKDTALAARLLKLANSAFYGFPTRIDSILKAVTLIGVRQLNILVLGIYATAAFKNISAVYIDMQSFWKHSLACGIVARILSSYRVSQITETFFLAGLLHDVGRLVLISSLPDLRVEAFRRANRTQAILTGVEESVFGFNHAHLGGLLGEKWNFPKLLENAIRYHHRPMESETPFEAAIVHVADVVANALGTGSSGEYYVPPLVPAAWEVLEMPAGVLRCIIQQADQRVSELAEIFLPNDTQLPQ